MYCGVASLNLFSDRKLWYRVAYMNNLIFLDTETTGNDLAKDRLCQVCYKNSSGIYTGFFKPPVLMSVKAMSVTNITNKMLIDKEPFQGSTMKKDLEALLTDGILVAHNALFDKAMLEAEGVVVPKFICTLRVARHLDSDNAIAEYNLQFLRYYYDLDIDAIAHDAEGDVRVLYAIFDKLSSEIKKGGLSDDEAIAKMMDISSKPSVFKKFNFGKYKDKYIEEVAKTDRGYLQWLLNQKLSDGGADEDWIYTLQTYLK